MSDELKKQFTFVWKIENFSFHEFMEKSAHFISPDFICFGLRKFNLIFHPKLYTITIIGNFFDLQYIEINYELLIGTYTTGKKTFLCDGRIWEIDFKKIMYHTHNDWLTIKFSIFNNDTDTTLNIDHDFAYGGIEVDKLQLICDKGIVWFPNLTRRDIIKFCSSLFSFPGYGDFSLTLRKSNDYINVAIELVSNFGCIGKPFRCEIIILGLAGRMWKSGPKLHVFREETKRVEFTLSIKISDLMKEKFLSPSNNYLSLCYNFAIQTGDIISKLKCKQIVQYIFDDQKSTFDASTLRECFSTLGLNQHDDEDLNNIVALQSIATASSIDSKLATIVDKQCLYENSDVDLLCEDLQRMYTDRKMTDVVFQVGDKTLLAHKFVLTARSPVFMAMFEQDMLERKSGIIDVTDIEYNTLDSMLLFMYGGKLQDMFYENAVKLLVASHKYQIVSLQKRCSTILQSMVTDGTICEILVYSDMVHDIELKESAVKYFKARAKCILQSAEWMELLENNLKLATEVLTEYAMEK